jgi:hypothetical protein
VPALPLSRGDTSPPALWTFTRTPRRSQHRTAPFCPLPSAFSPLPSPAAPSSSCCARCRRPPSSRRPLAPATPPLHRTGHAAASNVGLCNAVLSAPRSILNRLQRSATRTCAAVPAASDTFGTTTPNALFGRAASPWTRPSGRRPALPCPPATSAAPAGQLQTSPHETTSASTWPRACTTHPVDLDAPSLFNCSEPLGSAPLLHSLLFCPPLAAPSPSQWRGK